MQNLEFSFKSTSRSMVTPAVMRNAILTLRVTTNAMQNVTKRRVSGWRMMRCCEGVSSLNTNLPPIADTIDAMPHDAGEFAKAAMLETSIWYVQLFLKNAHRRRTTNGPS